MTCPECGYTAELLPPQERCPRCGSALATLPPAPAEAELPDFLPPGSQPEATVGTLPPAQPVRQRRRGLLIGLMAALGLLLAGGGALAGAFFFGWFAGPAPASVLPGTAVAYLRLDINPALAQKVALAGFFKGVQAVDQAAADGTVDTRKVLWEVAKEGDSDGRLAAVDYDTQIAPWLGDRIGFALVPDGSTEPKVVVAVQVTDAGIAERELVRLVDGSADVTLRDGYALLTEPSDTAALLADLDAGTLAGRADFAADLAPVGAAAVASAWLDVEGVARLIPGAQQQPSGWATGNVVTALQVTGDTLELIGRAEADHAVVQTGAAGRGLGDLPASTLAGVNVRDGAEVLMSAWDQQVASADRALLEDQLTAMLPGLTLPDDLAALLGESFTLAIDSDDLEAVLRGDAAPKVAAVVAGQQAARAQQVTDGLRGLLDPENYLGLTDRLEADSYLVATSQGYLDELAGGTGPRLAEGEDLARVVPDHATAVTSCYVALPPLIATIPDPDLPAEFAEFAKALRGFGSQSTVVDGKSAFMIRLVRS